MLTREQLEERRTGIGASEIAAVAGLNPYVTPTAVWATKVLPVPEIEEPEVPKPGRDPMRWGARIQRLVTREWFEMHHFFSMLEEEQLRTLRHPEVGIALASPDAIALDTDGQWFRGCEAKAPGLRAGDTWRGDAAPEEYIIQCQWLMFVTGLKRWDLCALIGGQDFQLRPVERDDEMIGNLVEIAQKFWRDYVITNTPPAIDHTAGTAQYLARRFPVETRGLLLPASAEAMTIAQEIRTWTATKKEAEEQEQTARNRLRWLCGEAEGIEGICTLRLAKGSSYTVTRKPARRLRLLDERED